MDVNKLKTKIDELLKEEFENNENSLVVVNYSFDLKVGSGKFTFANEVRLYRHHSQ